jgi:hypothetical protein
VAIRWQVKSEVEEGTERCGHNFLCHEPATADAEREAAWRRVLEGGCACYAELFEPAQKIEQLLRDGFMQGSFPDVTAAYSDARGKYMLFRGRRQSNYDPLAASGAT